MAYGDIAGIKKDWTDKEINDAKGAGYFFKPVATAQPYQGQPLMYGQATVTQNSIPSQPNMPAQPNNTQQYVAGSNMNNTQGISNPINLGTNINSNTSTSTNPYSISDLGKELSNFQSNYQTARQAEIDRELQKKKAIIKKNLEDANYSLDREASQVNSNYQSGLNNINKAALDAFDNYQARAARYGHNPTDAVFLSGSQAVDNAKRQDITNYETKKTDTLADIERRRQLAASLANNQTLDAQQWYETNKSSLGSDAYLKYFDTANSVLGGSILGWAQAMGKDPLTGNQTLGGQAQEQSNLSKIGKANIDGKLMDTLEGKTTNENLLNSQQNRDLNLANTTGILNINDNMIPQDSPLRNIKDYSAAINEIKQTPNWEKNPTNIVNIALLTYLRNQKGANMQKENPEMYNQYFPNGLDLKGAAISTIQGQNQLLQNQALQLQNEISNLLKETTVESQKNALKISQEQLKQLQISNQYSPQEKAAQLAQIKAQTEDIKAGRAIQWANVNNEQARINIAKNSLKNETILKGIENRNVTVNQLTGEKSINYEGIKNELQRMQNNGESMSTLEDYANYFGVPYTK